MFRPFLLIAACALAPSAAAAELSLTYSSSDIELVNIVEAGGTYISPPSPLNTPPPRSTTMDELRLSYGIGKTTSVYLAQRQVEDLMTHESQIWSSPTSEADALALGVEMRGPRRAGFAFIVRAEISSWDLVEPSSFGPPTEASFTSAGVGVGVEFLAADWIALRLDYQQDLVARNMAYGVSFGIRLNLDTADAF